MTMFTAEGLLRAHARVLDRGIASVFGVVWNAYQRWLQTQGFPDNAFGDAGWLVRETALGYQRAPGNTCLAALIDCEGTGREGPAPNDRKGCGGVMRVAPVGLVGEAFTAEQAFDHAKEIAWLTHGHPSGYLSAGALAVHCARADARR